MISRSKVRKALQIALDEKDPVVKGERAIINYPMAKFRHAIFPMCEKYKQIENVSYDFSDEYIKNKLTSVIFRTAARRIRLTYDYKTDRIECICIGKDCDVMKKTSTPQTIVEDVREFFSVVKKVIRIKKRQ